MIHFRNLKCLEKDIKLNGLRDFFDFKGLIYTMENYDNEGKEVSYKNKKTTNEILVLTSNRYNNGFKDLELQFNEDTGFYRNDINYKEDEEIKLKHSLTLSKDIDEIHSKLFAIWNEHQNEETKEVFLILDKLYNNFLKTQRKLLNFGAIELQKDERKYCPKCKRELVKSNLEQYSHYCENCDEDFYLCEV